MEVLTGMAKNVCAFVLLTTVINNLLQGSVYRKYIRYFSGLVILIIAVEPVMSILSMDVELTDAVSRYMDEADRYEIYEQMRIGSDKADGDIKKMYIQSLDSALDGILTRNNMKLVKSRWDIAGDAGENEYGKIKGVYVEAAPEGDIDIGNIRVDKDGVMHVDAYEEGAAMEIARVFGIEKELVNIEVHI